MPLPGAGREQEFRRRAVRREFAAMGQIGLDRRPGRFADRDQPFLRPLAADRDQVAVARQRAHRKGNQLGDPQPARIEQFQEGVQPEPPDTGPRLRGGEEASDLVLAQQGRERAAAPRRVDPRERVVSAHAFRDQEPEELA